MKVYGHRWYRYGKDKEYNEQMLRLKEIGLTCNKDEIERMIEFLKSVCNDIEKKNAEDGAHWHYRDYNKLLTEKQPDLIICFDKSITKEQRKAKHKEIIMNYKQKNNKLN